MDPREDAKDELRYAQAQLEAVLARMTMFVELFRDERDLAMRKAITLKVPSREVAEIIGTSSQYVNRILRGETYGRSHEG